MESTFCYRNISILGHVGFCRQKWSYVEDSMKCKDLSWGYHAWLAGCIHSLTKTETETPWTTSHIISLIIPQKCSWGGVQRLKLVEMSSQLQGHLLTTTAMPIILSLNKLQIGEFFLKKTPSAVVMKGKVSFSNQKHFCTNHRLIQVQRLLHGSVTSIRSQQTLAGLWTPTFSLTSPI